MCAEVMSLFRSFSFKICVDARRRKSLFGFIGKLLINLIFVLLFMEISSFHDYKSRKR